MSSYLSFFSGALGLDLGLEQSGLRALSVNEIDAAACATIRLNRPELPLLCQDIRELSSGLLQDRFVGGDDLFAVVGGPPCQAFSTAGRRLGLNDDRGNVFLHFIQLITELRPRYAVFENVRGLLSAPLVHRPHSQRGGKHPPLTSDEKPGGALLRILAMLEAAGYTTTFTLYNMANYGVPQIRERLIFFASRDGRGVPFMRPTHSLRREAQGLSKWRTFRDCVQGLPKDQRFSRFPEKRLSFLKLLKEGQNWRNLPPELHGAAMGASLAANGGKTGFYRRLAWDKPSPTLVTRPNMPATALCHPEELRPLSVEEYARIQTFPDEYSFCGRLDDQYRQIGNAVPPAFGQCIGEHLLRFDRGEIDEAHSLFKLSRYAGTDHFSWRESMRAQNHPKLLF